MDIMDLTSIMPVFISPELDTQLRAHAPHSPKALRAFILKLIIAGHSKVAASRAALEPLPQLLGETDTIRHVLRVENTLYSQLTHLAATLQKDRSVLIQYFIREALGQEQVTLPA